jgi:hypothetical protein
VRTRRVKTHWYELEAIVIGYGEACRYCSDREVWRPGEGQELMVQSAPEANFKWPELRPYKPSRFFQEHPYLIWRLVR